MSEDVTLQRLVDGYFFLKDLKYHLYVDFMQSSNYINMKTGQFDTINEDMQYITLAMAEVRDRLADEFDYDIESKIKR